MLWGLAILWVDWKRREKNFFLPSGLELFPNLNEKEEQNKTILLLCMCASVKEDMISLEVVNNKTKEGV